MTKPSEAPVEAPFEHRFGHREGQNAGQHVPAAVRNLFPQSNVRGEVTSFPFTDGVTGLGEVHFHNSPPRKTKKSSMGDGSYVTWHGPDGSNLIMPDYCPFVFRGGIFTVPTGVDLGIGRGPSKREGWTAKARDAYDRSVVLGVVAPFTTSGGLDAEEMKLIAELGLDNVSCQTETKGRAAIKSLLWKRLADQGMVPYFLKLAGLDWQIGDWIIGEGFPPFQLKPETERMFPGAMNGTYEDNNTRAGCTMTNDVMQHFTRKGEALDDQTVVKLIQKRIAVRKYRPATTEEVDTYYLNRIEDLKKEHEQAMKRLHEKNAHC